MLLWRMTSTSRSFIIIASIIDDFGGLDRSLHVLLSDVIIDIWYAKTIIMWLTGCILEKDTAAGHWKTHLVFVLFYRGKGRWERVCVRSVCVRVRERVRQRKMVKGSLFFLFAILPAERERDVHALTLLSFTHTHARTHNHTHVTFFLRFESCHFLP